MCFSLYVCQVYINLCCGTFSPCMQGFMWDIAPAYSAMLLFVEHRYYGQSLPFGDDSFKDVDHLQFLTSTQALADFATFITAFQEELVVRLSQPSHSELS